MPSCVNGQYVYGQSEKKEKDKKDLADPKKILAQVFTNGEHSDQIASKNLAQIDQKKVGPQNSELSLPSQNALPEKSN